MPDSKTVGKEFLAGVIAKLPESLRAQAEQTFAAAEAEVAVAELGAGVLRQQDYSRAMDAARAKETEVTQWHSTLTDWYATEQERLKAAHAALEAKPASPAVPPTPTPAPSTTVSGLSREDLQKEFDAFGSLALGVMTMMNRLTASHMKEFGEVLDTQQLLTHPKVKEIGLDGAYREVYKEKLDQKAADADAARVRQIEEAAVAKYRASNPNLPYPVTPQVQSSTLDGLGKTAADFSTEAAAALYNDLVGQKFGQSPGA